MPHEAQTPENARFVRLLVDFGFPHEFLPAAPTASTHHNPDGGPRVLFSSQMPVLKYSSPAASKL
jgi:hypothetical protein